MIDAMKKKAEAVSFNGVGDGYIHAEMKAGGNPEYIINGDAKPVLWLIMQLVRSMAEKTKASVPEVLGLINALDKAERK